MVRLACLRCASIREGSRCPKCKHPTHDLESAAGRAALRGTIRRRRTGRLLFVMGMAVWLNALGFLVYVFATGQEVICMEVPLLIGTPMLLASFAFGLRVAPLEALEKPPGERTARRWWQRDRGPTRF